jgi:hypothetical protein
MFQGSFDFRTEIITYAKDATQNTLLRTRDKGRLPLERASVLKPKLMTCLRNVVFLGKIQKTRVQEGIDLI